MKLLVMLVNVVNICEMLYPLNFKNITFALTKFNNINVTRKITHILKGYLGSWHTWKKVPTHVKDNMFGKLKVTNYFFKS